MAQQGGIDRTMIQPELPEDSSPEVIMDYLIQQHEALQDSYDRLAQRLNELDGDTITITTTAHTVDDNDKVILVDDDTAGSTVTITLPPAASNHGFIYHIKKLGTTANVVVDGDGSETIDGGTTATLTAQYESIMIVSDASSWHII